MDFTAVHMETGWEAPSHEEYMEYLEGVLGPIVRLRAEGGGFLDLVRKQRMWPSRVSRWCTGELKIDPLRAHLDSIGRPPVNAVGIRAGESLARAMLSRWEPWGTRRGRRRPKIDVVSWYPLLGWEVEDVAAIHRRHGVKPNPLYRMGMSRVGCWPCIFARKAEIRLLAELDPGRVDLIARVEEEVGATFWHKKGNDGGTCGIRDAVRWANTSHGGRQLAMFQDEGAPICVAWGLCE